jgi:hypothetical protein
MKLAIVGSRSFNDYDLLCDFIEENYNVKEITEIVSGGARGADALGERFANDYLKELTVFPADWEKHGKKAGLLRNVDIIKNCDECVCFWDGESHGTKHDIELCEKMNKPYKICYFKK